MNKISNKNDNNNETNLIDNSIIKNEIKLASLYTSYLGIFIFPDKKLNNKIHGFMKLDECYYSDAMFKFIITIPSNFPNSIPKINFINKIFHPLINYETGELDIDILFPNWQLKKGQQLMDILVKLKGLFYQKELIEVENSYNSDAYTLFKSDLKEFLSKSTENAVESKESFNNHYENCPYAFDKIHSIPKEVKEILEDKNDNKENKINKIKNIILKEIKNK